METMETNPKSGNLFLRMLEIKKEIRKCVQSGGDLKNVESKYGIKFAKPL